ncbi:MAG: ParB/RepB/Spo0J family partition protein [Verrucomicrobiales bacterium]|nr:ParB/RepB/Spo0J family partition protein [Verrucomicrobiales bacterium]
MSKAALGRGLSALLGGKPAGGAVPPTPAATVATPGPDAAQAGGVASVATGVVQTGPRVEHVPVTRVRPSALQPRHDFPPESLQELADSIRAQGILQPLVVRRSGEFLELIAGERRWRASQLAGLTEVPVIIREADDTTALELMLVENLQREDLNPMDEAQGYQELIERFRLTQEGVATKVGRSRTAVANALRLLKLPAPVQGQLREGVLSTGHAKVLLGLGSTELVASAAQRVVTERLSVRQAEELVARLSAPPPPKSAAVSNTATPVPVSTRDPHVVAIEDRLCQRLGTKVTVRYRQGRGQIDIRFFSDDELERFLELVGVRLDE